MLRLSHIRLVGCICLGIATFNLVSFSIHGSFEFPGPTVVGIVVGSALAGMWNYLLKFRAELQSEIKKKNKILEQQALSSERLNLATRHSSIWDWDLATGDLFISPSLPAVLGYSVQEFEAETKAGFSQIVHPDDRDTYRMRLHAHLDQPRSSFTSEHRLRAKSGEYLWFDAVGNSILDDAGNSVRFVGTTTDVTKRVNLERNLHQAQKMEAIGQLTGGVAHDFNNLLAVMLGNFELIKELEDPDEIRDLADVGISAAKKGAHLTQSMLSFAGKSSFELKVFCLNDVVRDTRKWAANSVPESITLNASFCEGLHLVKADPALAQTALLNLLLNARDATQDTGTINIETSNVTLKQVLTDGAGEEIPTGDYALLTVSDTGEGISEENLSHIYEPFFTTKPTGSGSGLGLSMVQGFMHQSGGFIQAHSEPGIGTTFKLFFPALLESEASKDRSAQAEIDPPAENTRILLVEDQKGVLDVLHKILTGAGYQVSTANSGDEAAALWDTDKAFDLLLTDVVMPGKLQGPLLAQYIRQTAPDLPVVFLTGYFSEATVQERDLNPEDARLMKPVAIHDLLETVANALAKTSKNPDH